MPRRISAAACWPYWRPRSKGGPEISMKRHGVEVFIMRFVASKDNDIREAHSSGVLFCPPETFVKSCVPSSPPANTTAPSKLQQQLANRILNYIRDQNL